MVDINTIQTYTDDQIVTILRAALIDTAFAKNYAINGRQIGRMSGDEIQKLIDVYERRVEAVANPGGMNVLIRRGEVV